MCNLKNTNSIYLSKIAILLLPKHRQHPNLVHCKLSQPKQFLMSTVVSLSVSLTNISSSASWELESSLQVLSESTNNLC